MSPTSPDDAPPSHSYQYILKMEGVLGIKLKITIRIAEVLITSPGTSVSGSTVIDTRPPAERVFTGTLSLHPVQPTGNEELLRRTVYSKFPDEIEAAYRTVVQRYLD